MERERGGGQWRAMEDCSTDEQPQQETRCRRQWSDQYVERPETSMMQNVVVVCLQCLLVDVVRHTGTLAPDHVDKMSITRRRTFPQFPDVVLASTSSDFRAALALRLSRSLQRGSGRWKWRWRASAWSRPSLIGWRPCSLSTPCIWPSARFDDDMPVYKGNEVQQVKKNSSSLNKHYFSYMGSLITSNNNSGKEAKKTMNWKSNDSLWQCENVLLRLVANAVESCWMWNADNVVVSSISPGRQKTLLGN